MTLWSSNTMLLTEKSLDYLWTKQTVSSNNIVNAETPGFKSSYVTFEEELQQNIGRLRSQKGREIRQQINATQYRVHRTDNERNKMDESNVDIVAENAELAKSGIQYEYAVRAISDDFTRLRTAIKGT